jgi:hypothetical protein
MSELEQALVELGRELELPPTPDLAAAVRQRLEARPALRRPFVRRRVVLVFAALAIAIGAAFAVPPARTAILEFLGLRGATIERVEELPDAPAEPAPQEPAGEAPPILLPDVAGLLPGFDVDQLGERATLAEARARAGFELVVPGALGEPDLVYFDSSVPAGRISFVYLPNTKTPAVTGVGLLLTQFSGELSPDLIGKLVQATDVEQVAIGGAPGYWLSGEPHVFFYRDTEGEVRDETMRLAGNTLLVERGDLLIRIEAEIGKEEALEIARSLR